MTSSHELASSLERLVAHHLQKDLLRFTTAGSVDDGKSTLIGRLLHDSKAIYEDQLASVRSSRLNGGFGGDSGGCYARIAGTDSPACVYRVAAGDSQCCCGDQQNGPG